MAALVQAPLRNWNRVGHISRQFPLVGVRRRRIRVGGLGKPRGWCAACCRYSLDDTPSTGADVPTVQTSGTASDGGQPVGAVRLGCAGSSKRSTLPLSAMLPPATPASPFGCPPPRRTNQSRRLALSTVEPICNSLRGHTQQPQKRRRLPTSCCPHASMPLIAQHWMASAV